VHGDGETHRQLVQSQIYVPYLGGREQGRLIALAKGHSAQSEQPCRSWLHGGGQPQAMTSWLDFPFL